MLTTGVENTMKRGKPVDWFDIWLIKQAKFTCELTRRYVVEDKGY